MSPLEKVNDLTKFILLDHRYAKIFLYLYMVKQGTVYVQKIIGLKQLDMFTSPAQLMYKREERFYESPNERDIEIYRRLSQGANSLHGSIADIMPYKRRNDIFKDKISSWMKVKSVRRLLLT